ncbi:thioredoxin-domain-containing protein [Hypomontagnella monticulosa]|nr:thioredoxin-domain-containing protein [Hypomontagnella monticulosa]
MSTNIFRAAQSTFRQSIYRPSHITSIRQFHTTFPKMTVHNIQTTEAFKQAIKDNKVVMLDCFATWCGPCKAIAPILANHSNDEQFKDIFFAKIDVDELPDLSQELGITAMPTFMLFKDGEMEPAEKLVGANPNALVAMLKKHAA